MTVVIETERLLLSELEPKDIDFFSGLFSNPKIMRFYPKLYSRKEAEAMLERQFFRYRVQGHGLWLLEDKQLQKPVGILGLLMQSVDFKAEPEIGYVLHCDYWRHGYASEAGIATRDYAFKTLKYPYVISLIRPVNLPSQAVARRLGMAISKTTKFMNIEHHVFRVNNNSILESKN